MVWHPHSRISYFLKNRYPSSIFKLLFIRPGCTGREGNTGALRVVFQCIMDYEHK